MKNVAARTPVVLVIFDEFAMSSIMTERGTIDAVRYPNFGALARSSTWHRNATTVHDYTFWAVPAILTGMRPTTTSCRLLRTIHRISSRFSAAAIGSMRSSR